MKKLFILIITIFSITNFSIGDDYFKETISKLEERQEFLSYCGNLGQSPEEYALLTADKYDRTSKKVTTLEKLKKAIDKEPEGSKRRQELIRSFEKTLESNSYFDIDHEIQMIMNDLYLPQNLAGLEEKYIKIYEKAKERIIEIEADINKEADCLEKDKEELLNMKKRAESKRYAKHTQSDYYSAGYLQVEDYLMRDDFVHNMDVLRKTKEYFKRWMETQQELLDHLTRKGSKRFFGESKEKLTPEETFTPEYLSFFKRLAEIKSNQLELILRKIRNCISLLSKNYTNLDNIIAVEFASLERIIMTTEEIEREEYKKRYEK